MSLHEFYTMGGYAAYVWPAFAVVTCTLVGQWILAKRHQRKMILKIREVCHYPEYRMQTHDRAQRLSLRVEGEDPEGRHCEELATKQSKRS